MLALCLKIFFVRIIDVSLGTFRTLTTVKEKNVLASCIGFFEVLVWFLIVKEALNTESNSIWIGVSYALGFATGTYIGGFLSNLLMKDTYMVQIITDKLSGKMTKELRDNGYALSILKLESSAEHPKHLIYIGLNKRRLSKLEKIVYKYDKKAFIVINDTKKVANGYFPNAITNAK